MNISSHAQIPQHNLKLWLRGDTNVLHANNLVSNWQDNSVNAYAALQTDANFRPTLEFDNQIQSNTIKFNGVNNILLVDFGTPTPQPNIYFIVWKTQGTAQVQIPFASSPSVNALVLYNGQLQLNGGSGQNYYNQAPPFNYIISSCEFNGNTSKLYRNGVLKNTRNSGLNPLDNIFEIGGLRSQAAQFPALPGWFYGNIAEIIMFDTILPAAERKQVEEYIANKYTQPITLGPDIVACASSVKVGFNSNSQYEDITWSTGATNTDSINITQNGTYWVTIKSFGLTITDTIKITGIVQTPQISLNNDRVVCFGDSLQVNYTPVPGFTPTWINGQTTNSVIVKDSSQFVQVTHTDTNNCSASSAVYFVSVDSLKIQSTLGNDRNVCDGANIFVETISNQGPFKYNWSTGDTTSFTNAPAFGVQNIFIELIDFNLCVFKDTVQINSLNLPAPVVNFSFDTVCPNLPTQFTDLSGPGGTDNLTDWKWAFINNDSAFIENPTYSFPQGNYNVSLTIETDSGCVNTLVKQIRTHKQATAKINTPIICAESEDRIISSSFVGIPDYITTYTWTVDGNTYASANPEVIFSNEGFNNVQLIVETDKGCLDTTNKIIEVFPALNPDFEVSNICIGDSIQFTDITPSFSIIEKTWRFGVLNETSTEENPKFLYPNTGNFNVKLSVTNAIGCSDFIEKTVEIHELPNASAAFENTCINDLSLFTDASTVNNGFVSEMFWTINGSVFTGDSVQYIFDTLASQTITHSIVDNFACTDDTTFQVQINALPEVDFSFTPTYGTAPIEVSFTNLSSNALSYTWNFGDNNNNSNDENPVYTYTENGVYNIVLSATNQFACSSSIFKQLVVAPTNLDLEISNLSFNKTTLADGSIAYMPSVLLKNVGTRLITNVDLYAAVDNETKIAETWTGALGIGQAFLYEFTSYFVIQNNELLDYICVSGNNVNDNTESNLSNNKTCEIQKGILQTSPLFPNPTNSISYMDVVSKNKGTLKLDVYDLLGKRIFGYKNINLEKGYNQIAIDCITLQAGTYYVNLTYLDETYTQKLVITNQ